MEAIKIVANVWVDVKPKTIEHCFRKAGFVAFNNNEVTLEDHQYIDHDLETDTSLEKAIMELDPNCCAIDYLNIDESLVCYEMPTDLDILESVTNTEPQLNDAVLNNANMDTEDDESENVEPLPITVQSVTENLMFMTNTLQNTCEVPPEIFHHYYNVQRFFMKTYKIPSHSFP